MTVSDAGQITETLNGFSNDALEAAAQLVQKLGDLETMHGLSVSEFAAVAASDIRRLKVP